MNRYYTAHIFNFILTIKTKENSIQLIYLQPNRDNYSKEQQYGVVNNISTDDIRGQETTFLKNAVQRQIMLSAEYGKKVKIKYEYK